MWLTIIAIILWRASASVFNLFRAPITSSANAQVLTDTTAAYATSRFLGNSFESILTAIFILGLMLIWMRSSKQKPPIK